MSSIEWGVDAGTARRTVAGNTAPIQTATQALQKISDIGSSSNQIVAGDLLTFSGSVQGPPDFRIAYSCSGLTCTGTTILGDTVTLATAAYETEEIQPIMVHNGVNIGQRRARTPDVRGVDHDIYEYGGWMEHSAFFGRAIYVTTYANPEFVTVETVAVGNSPNTNPTGTGTGTWTGAVAGVDYNVGQNWGNVIHGTATIGVDFSAPNVDVSFSNLVDLDNPGRSVAITGWINIPLSSGAFSSGSGSNQIKGRFYGPNHEEVAGTFDRSGITGAFGATR